MDSLSKVLGNQSFLENLLLLLIAAALTGVLVPLIKARMDDNKYRQQRLFEAQLARQAKVIESQVALLENLSQLLWQFQFACLAVSYYGQDSDYEKRYQEELLRYDKRSWVLMAKIGTEIGKAQRLVSEESYLNLKDFYDSWMIDVDNRISILEHKKALPKEWETHHDAVFSEGRMRIDSVLAPMAKELRLEGPPSEPVARAR